MGCQSENIAHWQQCVVRCQSNKLMLVLSLHTVAAQHEEWNQRGIWLKFSVDGLFHHHEHFVLWPFTQVHITCAIDNQGISTNSSPHWDCETHTRAINEIITRWLVRTLTVLSSLFSVLCRLCIVGVLIVVSGHLTVINRKLACGTLCIPKL